MKLQSLNTFELLNEETIHVITGGSAAAKPSKKKDVTSEKQDSASNDHFNAALA
jgi:hypothetical protein